MTGFRYLCDVAMRDDPIVAEVRAIRDKLAAECGYDVDLLVIKEGLGPRRGESTGRIRGQLPAERRGVDIVLVSPEEVERNRDEIYQAVGQALAHGRTIYERE